MLKDYNTLTEAHQALIKNGFSANFQEKDEAIVNVDNHKAYTFDELTIHNTYRFEGMSNPADSSMLVSVEAKDGTKGTLVTAYGNVNSTKLMELIQPIGIKAKGNPYRN